MMSKFLQWCVKMYQTVRFGKPSPCRYVPSCSEYAHEAIEVHGAARGSWLAIKRISRCHPFGGYGSDPVPEPRVERVQLPVK